MTSKIDVAPNIDAYFEEIVHDAVQARRLEATEAAERYLIAMLAEYARGEHPDPFTEPFTFQLRDALSAHGASRFQRLRVVGDGVLYALGFFGTKVTRHGADPEYVMSVGSTAYGEASAMLRGPSAAPNVLEELSVKFDRFVSVMTEIADGLLGGPFDDASVLRLYERWLDTGSERLARALGSMGLCPVRPGGSSPGSSGSAN
jgi:hypothetical protein